MDIRPLIFAALLAACTATGPGAVPSTPPAVYEDEGQSPLLNWSLTYPAAVAAIPPLADSLRAVFAREKADNFATAATDQAERSKQGYPFHSYELANAFAIAGSTPALLSITNEWMAYTGGAHPNHGTTAILWDRPAGRAIALSELTGGVAVLDRLYRDAFCTALTAERARRRGGVDAASAPGDLFSACPKLAELTVIPAGSAAGGPMTRLTFHADPYVAGPYVEGNYDIALPVTAAFVASLKPAYQASFAASP
ncbi:MAG: DUF4163 domain-containing protein [Sphingomicrobium sp.]